MKETSKLKQVAAEATHGLALKWTYSPKYCTTERFVYAAHRRWYTREGRWDLLFQFKGTELNTTTYIVCQTIDPAHSAPAYDGTIQRWITFMNEDSFQTVSLLFFAVLEKEYWENNSHIYKFAKLLFKLQYLNKIFPDNIRLSG